MDMDSEMNYGSQQSSVQARVLPIVVLSLLACLIGLTVYLFLEVRSAKTEFAAQLQAHEERFAEIEGIVNRTSRTVDTRVEELKGVVASAEKDLSKATQQVEQRVLGKTQTLAKELEKTRAEQKSAISEVGGKVEQLSEVAAKTQGRVGSLTGEVGVVKEEVTKTRKELEDTIRELKTVRGDLGVQSGLIATNAGELQALRELGERNYYDFDITKTKQPQRVGTIQIRLRKADQKRNKYTIELWADDKKVEKKNKTLLEPVQFYVIGARQPYEIVVQTVEKDRIVGYLSAPKVEQRRTAQNTSGSD